MLLHIISWYAGQRCVYQRFKLQRVII